MFAIPPCMFSKKTIKSVKISENVRKLFNHIIIRKNTQVTYSIFIEKNTKIKRQVLKSPLLPKS